MSPSSEQNCNTAVFLNEAIYWDHVYYRRPQSTYRLTVDWYIGWHSTDKCAHIGWKLVDISVDCQSTDKCVHIGWCIGRLSAYISVDYQPICQPRPPLVHMIHLLYTAIYVKEMITNLRSFDYWINSPCQYQRKCEGKSMEKMDTDVRV